MQRISACKCPKYFGYVEEHSSRIECNGVNDITQTEIHMGKPLVAKSTAFALFI